VCRNFLNPLKLTSSLQHIQILRLLEVKCRQLFNLPFLCEEKFDVHVKANNRFKYQTVHNRISVTGAEFGFLYYSIYFPYLFFVVCKYFMPYCGWYLCLLLIIEHHHTPFIT
jgi:hypothetical protein